MTVSLPRVQKTVKPLSIETCVPFYGDMHAHHSFTGASRLSLHNFSVENVQLL